jgi:hypothetical protein
MTGCEKCGGEVRELIGQLEFEDPYVGLIILKEASFLRCENLHILYPVETLRRIEKTLVKMSHSFPDGFRLNVDVHFSFPGLMRN